MKICVVVNKNFEEFNKIVKSSLKKVDLVLLSYITFPEISYQEEIENKTSYIKKIIKLSNELNCLVMVGTYFDLFGKKHCSVLVCDCGELLGIADSVYAGDKFDKGKELKIFKTKWGDIGIIVNEDLFNNKTVITLKQFGAIFFININESSLIEVNNTIFETGRVTDMNIININSNSFVFYNKNKRENEIDFSEYTTKHFKI